MTSRQMNSSRILLSRHRGHCPACDDQHHVYYHLGTGDVEVPCMVCRVENFRMVCKSNHYYFNELELAEYRTTALEAVTLRALKIGLDKGT